MNFDFLSKINLGWVYLFTTIITSVTSQILIKWRVSTFVVKMLPMPIELWGKIVFLFKVVFDPFIFSALCLTFISGLCWMATMTKFDISFAYPFTLLGFVAVLLLSALLLGENFNAYKIVGCVIIILGVLITSKGL